MVSIPKTPQYFLDIIAKACKNNRNIITAFESVPRVLFVPENFKTKAYEDNALPIGLGQTISQPSTVAHMLMMLEVTKDDVILEIGSGSGFLTALLATLAKSVYAIERIPNLFESSRKVTRSLGIRNVKFLAGDGALGWSEHAPYNKIIASAEAKRVPIVLLTQLAEGGTLLIPLNNRLMKYKKVNGEIVSETGIPVNFVDFVGS